MRRNGTETIVFLTIGRDSHTIRHTYGHDWCLEIFCIERQQLLQTSFACCCRLPIQIFRTANIDLQAINQFFHSPKLLPAISFHSNWEEANASSNIDAGEEVNTQDVVNLSVIPWSANFSHISSPFEFDTTTPRHAGFREMAEYSLILASLEKVYRWHRGRYITSISTAQELRPVRARSLDPEAQFELEARIKSIRFRPKLVGGVAQAVSAKLFYDTFQ